MPKHLAAAEIFIALGGNIGDVLNNFCSARTAIAQLSDSGSIRSSLLYRTPPLGPSGQADYYNAVIAVQNNLEPLNLLDALQSIEVSHHRQRIQHWGPRTLDLDIIAHTTSLIQLDRLIVPHIEMQHRQFVLRPLCDIAADWQHPILKKSAMQLLKSLLETGETPLPQGIKW